MDYRTLGRTGLDVSLLSLGTGGPSRMGQRRNADFSEMRELVRGALELGVNLFDTSPLYSRSEQLLGRALKGVPRDTYKLATKFAPGIQIPFPPASSLESSLRASLAHLRTDHIDLFQMHSVPSEHMADILDLYMPVIGRLREQGALRFLGVTEDPLRDPDHQMLGSAIPTGLFDSVMVAYNILNPSAAESVIPQALDHNVGVIVMTAVRRGLVDKSTADERVRTAVSDGLISERVLPPEDPTGWMITPPYETIAQVAYRFAASPAGVSTVLTGTSRLKHLVDNARSLHGPSLPKENVDRIHAVFGKIQRPLAE